MTDHRLGPMQKIATPMRRFAGTDEVDYAIVGVGAGGGVLLQRLARAGFHVAGFEAGPFWDTERDWVSDETGSHKLSGPTSESRAATILLLWARTTAAKE